MHDEDQSQAIKGQGLEEEDEKKERKRERQTERGRVTWLSWIREGEELVKKERWSQKMSTIRDAAMGIEEQKKKKEKKRAVDRNKREGKITRESKEKTGEDLYARWRKRSIGGESGRGIRKKGRGKREKERSGGDIASLALAIAQANWKKINLQERERTYAM
jgi:hypothetical protein